MRNMARSIGVAIATALAANVAVSVAKASDWGSFTEPSPGTPAVIGSYANGCLTGAEALPLDGPGYQVVRPSRLRYFGHPELIAFVQEFTNALAAEGIGPIAVADLAQPRGGPMTYGHVSHETGLDVDVWFRLDLPRLPQNGREALDDISMVDAETGQLDPALWRPEMARMLQIAASDPRVARIFVNPVIKQAMCAGDWEDRDFLRRLRPWRGHDGHFHIRLNCPADSPDCQPQNPPPAGDGCGADLMAWFEPPPPTAPAATPPAPRPAPPPLPAACRQLFEDWTAS